VFVATALLSLCNPFLLSAAVVLLALSLLGSDVTVGATVVTSFFLLAAPLAASVAVSTVWGWCFSDSRGASPRSAGLLAGLFALLAILSDDTALHALRFLWVAQTLPISRCLLILAQASAFVCLTSSLVMVSVLLVEIPVRWCTSATAGWEVDGLARTGRWVGVAVSVSAAWFLVIEVADSRFGAVLQGLVSPSSKEAQK
jgi:hypothetical protein